MAGAEIICPECGAKSHSTREIPAGARLKCPQCAHIFPFGGVATATDEKSGPQAASPKPQPASAAEAVPESHVSETPRVEPAESPTRSGSHGKVDSKSDGVRRSVRRDDADDRPRSRRDDDRDRDDRPIKRKKRRKGARGNLLAAIGVFVVIFIMMMGVAGTVVGFAVFGGKAAPTIPTVAMGRGSIRGGANSGWLEDDDPPSLQSPSDDDTSDTKPLNANLTSIFQDAPYGFGRPRTLAGPLPMPPEVNQGTSNRAVISREVLAKVKEATTYIVVPFGDKGSASGSGFFVGKDVIATNAHVVGMLVPGSEQPKSIQVIIRQGQSEEAACSGKLLAWDSENDLALVQVKSDKPVRFPAPLEIVGAPGLYETQPVYVIGYPQGEQIGKAVTVAETTVSSLRQDASGRYERVQVNGGMTHGNSGGPVVNALGQVVGVAVSVIEGTQINFAVPAEHVSEFLAGRLLTLENGETTHKGGTYAFPVTVRATDPQKKFESVAVDSWWGNANDKVPAASKAPPKDEKRQTVALKRERDGVYSATVALGKEPVDGKVLWLQAHQRDKEGHEIYYQGLPMQILPPAEAKPVHLVYRPRKEAPKVAIQTRLAERVGVAERGIGSVEYSAMSQLREKRLGEDANKEWTFRYTLDNLDVREAQNGQSLDRVRSIDEHKKYLNKSSVRVQTNANGQITQARPAFKDIPNDSREALTRYVELIGRSLQFASVPFPDEEIQPKHTWESEFSLSLPSTQNRITFPVEIKYTYVGLRTIDGRQVAELALSGEVTDFDVEAAAGGGGVASAAPHSTGKKASVGKVGGYAFIDVKTGIISRMSIFAETSMSSELQAQSSGHNVDVKLAGMLEVKLQRQ